MPWELESPWMAANRLLDSLAGTNPASTKPVGLF